MVSENAISTMTQVLQEEGVHGALRFLNKRTPHRFTGIYRYDGDTLRNVYIFDVFDPDVTKGQDVPMADAYCANVGLKGSGIEFSDISAENSVETRHGSPVVSYCGALIRDLHGNRALYATMIRSPVTHPSTTCRFSRMSLRFFMMHWFGRVFPPQLPDIRQARTPT